VNAPCTWSKSLQANHTSTLSPRDTGSQDWLQIRGGCRSSPGAGSREDIDGDLLAVEAVVILPEIRKQVAVLKGRSLNRISRGVCLAK
jgi:hypothetical protein